MDYGLALDLANRLRRACPVDSGALRMSISRVQGSPFEYVITIGNNQGKEINGSCATVEYAAITNFAFELKIPNPRTGGFRTYQNRNYHWVNECVKDWIRANKLKFKAISDEEDVMNVGL